MWDWLQGLSGGAANFVGSFTGAAIGLIALLLGALFNAHLNRRRDDRIRREEACATATALKAELSGIDRTLLKNAESLNKPPPKDGGFNVPDPSHSVRVLPHVLPKFGSFDTDTIRLVLDAYSLVDQYCEALIMMGGKVDPNMPLHRRVVFLPAARAPHVITLNRNMSMQIHNAVAKLDAFLIGHGLNHG
jgi:hypothetical protein